MFMLSGHVKNEEKKSNCNMMELKLILSSRNAEMGYRIYSVFNFVLESGGSFKTHFKKFC